MNTNEMNQSGKCITNIFTVHAMKSIHNLPPSHGECHLARTVPCGSVYLRAKYLILVMFKCLSKISFHYRIELVETASILNRTNVFTNDPRSEGCATFNLVLKIFDVMR
eukprot:539250_1